MVSLPWETSSTDSNHQIEAATKPNKFDAIQHGTVRQEGARQTTSNTPALAAG